MTGADAEGDRPGEHLSDAPRHTRRPRGGPRGTTRSGGGARDRILAAARELFAQHGFDRTSVRGIAAAAGVDAALVHHYFGAGECGTKEQVFTAAVSDAAQPLARALPELLECESGHLGGRLTGAFLGLWEDPGTRGAMLAVARSGLTNDTAARLFRDVVVRDLARLVAGRLGTPDALLRVQLAAAQLVGAALLRHVLRVEPLAGESFDALTARVAPVVQSHLTGPAPSAGGAPGQRGDGTP